MQLVVSREVLTKLAPNPVGGIDQWFNGLNSLLPMFEINTKNRIAAFLAHTTYETVGYKVLREYTNYSSNNLMMYWSEIFNQHTAKAYANKPDAIANKIYANRMGNGDEASGDGWKYRGGGLIPITGKQNYSKFAQSAGMDIEDAAEYIETVQGAIHATCWQWKILGLNVYADAEDMSSMTKRITGGLIGADDRLHNYETIKELL